ncbi:MAG: hypothetical protein E7485_04020 [Ruminococcaceae bacterium]|nr:hypothetical protein [Oscillospiraceae bacterium]
MKFRRILATTAAAAIATAAMSVAASAVTVTDDTVGGDWGGEATVDFSNFEGFEGDVLVTVDFTTTVDDAHTYWLLAPADCNGWGKLTVDIIDDTLYYQQPDGFINVTDSTLTSIQFILDQDDIASMEANMTPTEDGGWYGGMLFQIYGVDITSVTLEDYAPAAEGGDAEGGDAEGGDSAGSTDGATDENKNSADTGVEGIAVAAGAVALAGAAVIASRKRK